MAGWALLPLRAFLGFTFTFAGLQKLANPGFFDASNPTSIQNQLASAARISPIHVLVAHLQGSAVPIGVIISLGELAVGAATLAGLWSRVAAVGGILLSLSLFLTVSYHSSPYYTGSDIVFVFAWIPMIVAGAGGVLSADSVMRDVARSRAGAGPATVVPVPFEVVQRVCGSYDSGACRAMSGAPCEPAPCPYLHDAAKVPAAPALGDIDRRTFTLQGVFAAALAGVALAGAGLAAGLGRLGNKSSASATPAPNPTTTTSTASGPTTTAIPSGSGPTTTATTTPVKVLSGTRVLAATAVPVGGSATFQDPRTGDPSVMVHPETATFAAFDAICPHEGCIVAFSAAQKKFICPCHGSEYNGATGALLRGPSTRGLGKIPVKEGPDGGLYVT
jgi:thiosulfate dehydrogenase (quinone) large subunit